MGIEQDINFTIFKYTSDVKKIESLVCDDILASVKELTPVKTGNAQRNWSIEQSVSGAVVTNPVSYIEHLEYGTSKQRAHAMVRLTMLKVDKFIASAVNKVNTNA